MDGRKVMNKCLVLEKTREGRRSGRTVERTNLSFHLLGKISRFYFKAAITDAPSSPSLSSLPFLLHKKRLRQALAAHLIMKNSHAEVDLFLQ